MYRTAGRTGLLALGTGAFAYLYHQKCHSHTLYAQEESDPDEQGLTTYFCDEDSVQRGRAMVPGDCVSEGPLVLQLKQVQVLFRHGARTPLHTIPKITEMEYDPQFVTREHQASLFPYERVSCATGCPVDWSDYEQNLKRRPLKGGACAGALTGYGKDEMYLLGKRLRECYRDRLSFCSYNPDEVYILSSNIQRTVESARCVMAGLFGRDHLCCYVQECCRPVRINVTESCYNILVPDAHNCEVLKKVNHSAMLHPDFIPGMRDDRLLVESYIDKELQEKMDCVKETQKKIDAQLCCYEAEGGPRHGVTDINEHRQNFVRDPLLYPLYKLRGKRMEQVDRLWSDVMARHPVLCQVMTEPDMSVLIYLRKLVVEEFVGKFQSGYRFHFYFDSNPYFHNRHLCKEVYTHVSPDAFPSKSTPIEWKTCGSVLPDLCPGGGGNTTPCECNTQMLEENAAPSKCDCPKSCACPNPCDCPKGCACPKTSKCKKHSGHPKSFFSWYVEPTCAANDNVGKAIKNDIWPRSLAYLQKLAAILHAGDPHAGCCVDESTEHGQGNRRTLKDPWNHKLNFVFGRDDLEARITHGWGGPNYLMNFRKKIAENAVKIMYYAMTGQHAAERCVVSSLSAGPLLTALVDQAERHITSDRKAHKLCLYSSHDSTMTGLLEILDIWDDKWPPFGADIRLELYKEVEGSEWYVRVLYCGKVMQVRCQGEDFVHWCDFKKAVRKFIIRQDEYKRVCSSDILERIARDLLKHDEGELPEKYEKPDILAGM